MCGIAGYVRIDGASVSGRRLAPMLDAILHRGPDDEGRFVEGPIAFGMRRLSVIDLEGGHQPIRDRESGRVITYNGECYNYRELREELRGEGAPFETSSDTEVVLQTVCRRDVEGLSALNGMFAFAVWHPARRTLLLVRDRVGIKPLYTWHGSFEGGELLVWASELKSLLRHPAVPRAVDGRGLSEFLTYGYTFPPTTILEGVRKLAPGQYLLLREGRLQVDRYTSPPMEAPARDPCGSMAESAALVREALQDSVRAQMVADVPVGAFLSGGVDSSSIAHFMKEFASGEVKTFSIGFGSADRFHDEAGYAAAYARQLGTDHHELRIEPDLMERLPRVTAYLDEPLADSSILVSYLISELARRHVTVALSGVGGDEIFAGYRRYLGYRLDRMSGSWWGRILRLPLRGAVAVLPKSRDSRIGNVARLASRYLSARTRDAVARYEEFVRTLAEADLGRLFPAYQAPTPAAVGEVSGFEGADALEKMIAFDFRGSLPEQLLHLTDRMSMAHSLEVRVPYLDNRMLDAARRVPSGHKIAGFKLRRVQKEALVPILPKEILTRKKRGFGFPLGRWIREDAGGFVADHLGEEAVKRRGLLDPAEVSRLLQEHRARAADHTDALTGLLFFELWARNVLDVRVPSPDARCSGSSSS